tara:strand:- start:764 stop:2038 length:1275 start_codon:yes stop_codon:yes gene_type:complete
MTLQRLISAIVTKAAVLSYCAVAFAENGGRMNGEALSESADEITTQIAELDESREDQSFYGPFETGFENWENLWDSVESASGLNLVFAYTTLFQTTSIGATPGMRSGGAGDLDILGRWKLIDEVNAIEWLNEGILGFNFEYRHRIGANTPSDVGLVSGSLWNTATGFNEQEFAPIQYWWQQKLFQNRFMVRIGKLDPSSIFDSYRFNSSNFFFVNQAFADNPTIPFPDNGWGVVGAWYPDDNWFLLFGSTNADGRKVETSTTLDQDIDAWFSAATGGWRGPVGNLGEGLYQITLWHSDPKTNSTRPGATGFSIVAQQELGNQWVPYLRYARSSAAATDTEQLFTIGAVLEDPFGQNGDRLGVSGGWGSPFDRTLRSQGVGEIFYRFEPFPEFQITPSFQFTSNPSRDPSQSLIGIFGIRGRINF